LLFCSRVSFVVQLPSLIYTLSLHDALPIWVDFPASIPFFQRAIQLDPDFAMAYDQLGGAYGSIGETVLDAENTRKAFELRGRTRSEEHTSELQSPCNLVCRLLLEKKKKKK